MLVRCLKLTKISQCCEFAPMCAARGKTILTLAVHTFLYHLPKSHKIIFHIEEVTAISNSPLLFPPNHPRVSPPTADFKGKLDIYVPHGCHIKKLAILENLYLKSEKKFFSKL